MKRGRFATMIAAVSLVVFAVSFVIALLVFDDDPATSPAGDVTAGDSTSTSTTAAPTTTPSVVLSTPAWVAVVASEGSAADAQRRAAAVAAAGYPTGTLRSDDYDSLQPGLWVAYAGPYPDSRAADAAVEALADDGFDGAYVRCIGSKHDCAGKGRSD